MRWGICYFCHHNPRTYNHPRKDLFVSAFVSFVTVENHYNVIRILFVYPSDDCAATILRSRGRRWWVVAQLHVFFSRLSVSYIVACITTSPHVIISSAFVAIIISDYSSRLDSPMDATPPPYTHTHFNALSTHPCADAHTAKECIVLSGLYVRFIGVISLAGTTIVC